jgi:hypothetical protein
VEVRSENSSGGNDARACGINNERGQTSNTHAPTKHASSDDAAQEMSSVMSPPQGFTLGAVEVGIVLGLLNVLFACFVIVQFRYFFGGAARVMSITELTYSEYARRGFFELTWVAGLVLPLLLITHALLGKDRPVAERVFRPLAGAQIALLFVIMASAVARMRLYQSEYGLTELRLYTTAFMLWLGIVFVWFAWTVVVRSRRQRFACGALIAAFITIGFLHLLNPDAFIVRANAAHARAGRAFDAEYAASLSADAVPTLISAMPSLSRDERCHVARELSYLWSYPTSGEDWRAWNFARSRARRTVTAHQESLSEAMACPPLQSAPVITHKSAPTPPMPLVAGPPPTTVTPTAPATNAVTTTTINTATSDIDNVTTMNMKTEPQNAASRTPKGAQPTRRDDKRKATGHKQSRAGKRAKAR